MLERPMETDDSEGFDRTPRGAAMIALLRRHAPPEVNPAMAARRVMTRLERRERARGPMRLLGPLVAAAASVVVVFAIFAEPRGEALGPVAAIPLAAPPAGRTSQPAPLAARVREIVEGSVVLDSGLARGLRVGDELEGPGCRLVVRGCGVFFSRCAMLEGQSPRRGAPIELRAMTPTRERALRFEPLGGEPGALFAFGAVLEDLEPGEARLRGISHGRALVCVETISALLETPRSEPVATQAALVGLQPGDILLRANGIDVADTAQLARALDFSRHSGALSLEVLRGGRVVNLKAR